MYPEQQEADRSYAFSIDPQLHPSKRHPTFEAGVCPSTIYFLRSCALRGIIFLVSECWEGL